MGLIVKEKKDNLLAGFPVVASKFRHGESLLFNRPKKRWEAGQNLIITYVATTAERRTDLGLDDTGLYAHWDAELKDLVVWTGTTWSDLDEP